MNQNSQQLSNINNKLERNASVIEMEVTNGYEMAV